MSWVAPSQLVELTWVASNLPTLGQAGSALQIWWRFANGYPDKLQMEHGSAFIFLRMAACKPPHRTTGILMLGKSRTPIRHPQVKTNKARRNNAGLLKQKLNKIQ